MKRFIFVLKDYLIILMKNYIHNINNEIVVAIFVSTVVLFKTNIPRISMWAIVTMIIQHGSIITAKGSRRGKNLQ